MNYTVTVKSRESKEAILIINDQLAEKLDLSKKKRGFVSFGTHRNYVDIKISTKIKEDEIYLSSNVIEDLHIPDYPSFEVRIKGNEIILGPCIGILASKKYENITKRRLKEIAIDTLAYSRIQGAVIVFSLDKVDKLNQLVEGYCYNPQKDSWEEGVFPYPASIYCRAGMNTNWKNHFLSVIGDRVFSNYSFDKWDMYRWFSVEPDIVSYLPETRVYSCKEDMFSMLEKYGVLYAKPIWGMKGFGVVRISKEESVRFQYRENDENKDIIAKNHEEVEKTLETLFEADEAIIQQGLNLIRYDGGIVDFRCVMQKDESCKWVCNAIVARVGAEESVVSNISSGGAAMPGMDLIDEALELSETGKFELKERMISLCRKVCSALDEYGFNFGTLGLDVGIDENLDLWLIEVNNRKPHPGIALRASDIPAYYTILTAPLHYAKALAGFGPKEE